MPHPHGDRCRCPAPRSDDGLLAYTVDCDHYDDLSAALERVVTLRVLTSDPTPPANLVAVAGVTPCDGTMCCSCPKCEAERAQRVRKGVRQIRQPWQPVQARRAA